MTAAAENFIREGGKRRKEEEWKRGGSEVEE